LDGIDLTYLEDTREMRFGPAKNFTVRTTYFILSFGGTLCPIAKDLWTSLAPCLVRNKGKIIEDKK
jgi:hypothetical protein